MTGALDWLERHRGGAAPVDVLAFADRLPAVEPGTLIGRWRGSELPTGSPLDGLLPAHRWYGKEFLDADTVHPLLFRDQAGVPRPVDPALAPLALLLRAPAPARSAPARAAFATVRPLLATRRPTARVRRLEHRGVLTAALVYDRLPVVDAFRQVSPDVLLGLMDARGLDAPFAFVLERDG
ncbi:GXWXG domain-containing protein [Geodermatophilus sp. CPCC 205761]|uniref:GXWXG domain-containing protein n=1 Tax=Geodermatophilus sp. CPCC 205761 TaxID=2936597 RepID=UPI003EEF63D2